MDVQYHDEIKILCFNVTNKTKKSANKSWEVLNAKIRAQAQDAHHRALNLEYKMRCVNDYLLARASFMTQIHPPPNNIVPQLYTTISWFIWKG